MARRRGPGPHRRRKPARAKRSPDDMLAKLKARPREIVDLRAANAVLTA